MTIESEPKHIQNEYYVEKDYAALAGPFSLNVKNQMQWFKNVINDMKRGNIDYRVVENHNGDSVIERKGMILPKR